MEATRRVARKDKLLTSNYLLVCFSSFGFFASFHLLLPTLPVYVTENLHGLESEVGLIIGVFTITAVVLRPFVGRSIDRRGKKLFLVVGAVVFLLSSVLYNFTNTVPLLLLLRAFHGVGIATFTTASTALIADIAPAERRGEAMGYFGMFSSVAMAVAPALGVVLIQAYDFTTLFLTSAVFAAIGVVLSGLVTEHSDPASDPPQQTRPTLFSRRAFFPAIVIFGFTVTYGAISSFLPLYADKQGFENPGLFFTVFAVTLIFVRIGTGWLSDRFGRATMIVPGLAVAALAMVMLAFSSTMWMFVVVGVVYGAGFAAVQPTMLAFVTDRVEPWERGAAMGTYTAAFDLGIGLGSILLGLVLQFTGFGTMFVVAGAICLLGLVYFVAGTFGVVDRITD